MNAAGQAKAPRRQLHILIADDERDSVTTLSALLIHEGHNVSAVYDGTQVLDAVKRYKPDVCILDIEMPGQSGYATARELVERVSANERPILIAISGKWTRASERLLAQSVGFDRFFLKPADPTAVLDFLDQVATVPIDGNACTT